MIIGAIYGLDAQLLLQLHVRVSVFSIQQQALQKDRRLFWTQSNNYEQASHLLYIDVQAILFDWLGTVEFQAIGLSDSC
jgi:hypothetical protein